MDRQLTMLLHNRQELDHDLRRWTAQNLTLATLFSINDGLEAVVEDRDAHLRE